MAERLKFELDTDLLYVVQHLSVKQTGELFIAILKYANNEPVDLSKNLMLELAFIPVKRKMDAYFNRKNPGDLHWNWKGGKTPENKLIRNGPSISAWRKEVFKRDKYTCQDCGQVGGILHAHHIKPFAEFPELRTTVENGLTLCKTCHNKAHRKGGKNG